MDYERLLVDNLATIDQVVRFIARRHHLAPDDAEELSASLRLKIIDNDYEVLRAFRHGSSLRTYLTAVAHRHFLDLRTARWGKWRPCAQAQRMGPLGILLDQLLTRDGLSIEEAAQVIGSRGAVVPSLDELRRMGERLPDRAPRRFVTDAHLSQMPASGDGEAALIRSIEGPVESRRIEAALAAALDTLAPQDRLVVKMRFLDGLQISDISRALTLPPKPLYRRIESLMGGLRRQLVQAGVSRSAVQALLQADDVDSGPHLPSSGWETRPGVRPLEERGRPAGRPSERTRNA